jgi:hypothetical protein
VEAQLDHSKYVSDNDFFIPPDGRWMKKKSVQTVVTE